LFMAKECNLFNIVNNDLPKCSSARFTPFTQCLIPLKDGLNLKILVSKSEF